MILDGAGLFGDVMHCGCRKANIERGIRQELPVKADTAGADKHIFDIGEISAGSLRTDAEKVFEQGAEVVARQIGIGHLDLVMRKAAANLLDTFSQGAF